MSHIADITQNPTQNRQPRSQRRLVFSIALLIAALTLIASQFGWRQGVLCIIGGLFGLCLYHASFGFASAYRRLIVHRDISGLLAQIVMLAIATLLFAPLLLSGSILGSSVAGAIAPIAVQGAVGAFIFGIGMQLGSGCACGTLYTIGAGSGIMPITLLTFGIGSFWSTLDSQRWQGLPKAEAFALVNAWGWLGVGLQLLVLFLLGIGLWYWHSQLYSQSSPLAVQSLVVANFWPRSLQDVLYGPWSILFGAVSLAVLNWLTLMIAGRPWGVTWGFTLWTAKLATGLGWNPATSPYWSQGVPANALNASVFADITSVMNFGIVLGAAFAAALAGRLALKKPSSYQAIAAALIGGFLMGYGARMAFGCNVGAYFSGIASTSLHGWLWIAFAILGTFVGVRLRPFFRLSN